MSIYHFNTFAGYAFYSNPNLKRDDLLINYDGITYRNAEDALKNEFYNWICAGIEMAARIKYGRKLNEKKYAEISKRMTDCIPVFDDIGLNDEPVKSIDHLFEKFLAYKKRMNMIMFCKIVFDDANKAGLEIEERESKSRMQESDKQSPNRSFP